MKINLTGAIEILKLHKHTTDKFRHSVGDQYVSDAIDTVIEWAEKPTYAEEDMEEFSFWYHRKVSVIGESELHLFGVRPFGDIIDFWKKERGEK